MRTYGIGLSGYDEMGKYSAVSSGAVLGYISGNLTGAYIGGNVAAMAYDRMYKKNPKMVSALNKAYRQRKSGFVPNYFVDRPRGIRFLMGRLRMMRMRRLSSCR